MFLVIIYNNIYFFREDQAYRMIQILFRRNFFSNNYFNFQSKEYSSIYPKTVKKNHLRLAIDSKFSNFDHRTLRMDFSLLKELVNEMEDFSSQTHSNSLDDFRNWLNTKAYERENPKHLFKKYELTVNDLENEICKQILLLNRFAKQMIRKGLQNYPQLANEEFTYLYRLADYDSLTKMQLVEKNGHEKQTGIEIIKRLLKYGLIEEFADKEDKRSTRVKVTKSGLDLFKKSSTQVTEVAKILSADLSDEEKKILLKTLKKLNEFHFNVYHEHKNSSFEDLGKLLPQKRK